MKCFWNVWFSRRRSIYIQIARKYHSTPWRVYHLGHGGVSKSKKDIMILQALKEEGIISHIYPW